MEKLSVVTKLAVSAVALVLAGLVVAVMMLVIGPARNVDNSADVMFSYPLPTHIEFRSPDRKERELPRSVVRDEDRHLVSATVPYESGKLAYIAYWTKGPGLGRIHTATVLYPRAEGQQEVQVARELEYAANGVDLIKDRIFYADGKSMHVGDAVAGGRYETFDYAEDGHSPMKHALFVKVRGDWISSLLQEYYPNGQLAKIRQMLEDGSFDLRTYGEDSHLLMHRLSDSFSTHIVTELYEADGQTIKTKTDESYASVSVMNYKNGKPTQENTFRFAYIVNIPNVLMITMYDADGQAQYRQKWVIGWDKISKLQQLSKVVLTPSIYTLAEVQYLNANMKVTKDIDLFDDHKTPRSIETHAKPENERPYPRVTKSFRADGTLEKLKEYNETGEVIKVEKHTSEDNIRETVDPDALEMHIWLELPDSLKRVTHERDDR